MLLEQNKIYIKYKCFFIFFALFFSANITFCQEIKIKTKDTPLNKVFLELRNKYGIQFSYNDELLSKYKISVNKTFKNSEEAINFLLLNSDLKFEKSGNVYLIFTKPKEKEIIVAEVPKPKIKYQISGKISDKTTGESLPFSILKINGIGIYTDASGNFAFTSLDSIFRLNISYLGYFQKDTLLKPGRKFNLFLSPASSELKEIIIEKSTIEYAIQVGSSAGTIRLNRRIADYLPCNGDNSVFNLLRLQPGVTAAGEQSSDLNIWGSYSGQTLVLFDGFTMFGLKNFNDNISSINPFTVKDIKLLKAAYSAEYGERVGGVADITGIDGKSGKKNIKLNINNNTINGLISVPIGKKNSIVFAYRQTYYNLYKNKEILSNFNQKIDSSILSASKLYPDYNFKDFNLKYSGKLTNGDSYFISLYRGWDKFWYNFDYEKDYIILKKETQEKNIQKCGAIVYNKVWKSGNISKITISRSQLNTQLFNIVDVHRKISGLDISRNNDFYENSIIEKSFRIENTKNLGLRNKLKFGFGIITHETSFIRDSFQINLVYREQKANRPNFYITDEFRLDSVFSFKYGLRNDFAFNLKKIYFEPRFEFSAKLNKFIKLNFAMGRYNQFIEKASVIDEQGNYRYIWTIADNKEIPVITSNHFVFGTIYTNKNFMASAEIFYKYTSGITRYISILGKENVFEGQNKSKGIDLFVKQEYKGSSVWVSYTLSQSLEHFPYNKVIKYHRAIQDQRHEVKVAGLLKLHSFYFGMNYVWGSGFPDPTPNKTDIFLEKKYSRFDISILYRLSREKYKFETGISVLNVLNTQNIKYDNFNRVPRNQTETIKIYSQAVPFTPTLFLNIEF